MYIDPNTIDDQRVMIINNGVHDVMIDGKSMIRSRGELPLGKCRLGTDSDYLPACCISPPTYYYYCYYHCCCISPPTTPMLPCIFSYT